LHQLCSSVDPRAAEPTEQLLRTVGGDTPPENRTRNQKCEIMHSVVVLHSAIIPA
jgi:hypothetical protein